MHRRRDRREQHRGNSDVTVGKRQHDKQKDQHRMNAAAMIQCEGQKMKQNTCDTERTWRDLEGLFEDANKQSQQWNWSNRLFIVGSVHGAGVS